MNNNILNGLELYRTKYFSDLVDENMLANALMTRPHEVQTVLSYVFGMFEGNTLDFLTQGMGKTMTVANREYEWPVMIQHDKAIEIQSAEWNGTAIADDSTPGINGTPIKMWLKEKWFGTGAILAFDNRDYQVRVAGEPYQDGAEFVYTVYVNGTSESYVDPAMFSAGCSVNREGSAYEEYSEEADIVNYQTPFKLRNQLSILRQSHDITGSAHSSVMVIAMKDPKTGKSSYLWSDYQEWQAMRQWYTTLERHSVYSQYNANTDGTVGMKGTNGRPVYVGAGLLQQIAGSNRQTYTRLTADLLEQFLFELSYNVLDKSQRNFVALTGEMGMKEFDRVLREKASSYQLVDSTFVTGSGQELTLGGQFTTWKMLNGITLTLKHVPMYDDTTYNRVEHPISGKPVESYRMTFLDFNSYDGESNISKVVRKDREMVMWHIAGSVAPGVGHATSIATNRANAKDGYSVNFLTEQGIMMKNPTTSGELIMELE